MSWEMQVIIPGRVAYVDYSEDATASDVSEALGAVIEEINKRENEFETFYCISEVGNGRNNKLSDLKAAFSQFKAIPSHTCTLLVTEDKVTSFLADVIFSMRGLRFERVDSVAEAVTFIEHEASDLKDHLSLDAFKVNTL